MAPLAGLVALVVAVPAAASDLQIYNRTKNHVIKEVRIWHADTGRRGANIASVPIPPGDDLNVTTEINLLNLPSDSLSSRGGCNRLNVEIVLASGGKHLFDKVDLCGAENFFVKFGPPYSGFFHTLHP